MHLLKYLWYVLSHKWAVFVFAARLGIPLRGLLHDWSKFLPRLFLAYARHFYGSRLEMPTYGSYFAPGTPYGNSGLVVYRIVDETAYLIPARVWQRFIWAFGVHFTREDHHWQYWLGADCLPRPMSRGAMLEMLADWMAMSRGKEGARVWYCSRREQIFLHQDTRRELEGILLT